MNQKRALPQRDRLRGSAQASALCVGSFARRGASGARAVIFNFLMLWVIGTLGAALGCQQEAPPQADTASATPGASRQSSPVEREAKNDSQAEAEPEPKTEPKPDSETESSSSAPTAKRAVKWLFVGDSLTAGYGLSKEEAYVHVLERRLTREGWRAKDQRLIKMINAGISGDTSAGALRRIDWLLEDGIDLVFLCIGANDGLRGQPIEALRENLTQIIKRVRARGASVVLMGMKLPPNYGPRYTARFAEVYPEVARALNVKLLPFLLEGVAGKQEYNLSDGIHPNREGQTRVASVVFEFLRAQDLITRSKDPL